jgi:hypothetical protein
MSKVKIMSKAPEVSDEEIRKLMNFSGLIEKQKRSVMQRARINKNIWAAVIATSIVGIATLIYFNWPAQTPDPSPIKSETIVSDSVGKEIISSLPVNEELTKKENTIIPIQKDQKEKQTTADVETKTNNTGKVVQPAQTVQYTEAEPVEGFPHLYDYFNRVLAYPAVALKRFYTGNSNSELYHQPRRQGRKFSNRQLAGRCI